MASPLACRTMAVTPTVHPTGPSEVSPRAQPAWIPARRRVGDVGVLGAGTETTAVAGGRSRRRQDRSRQGDQSLDWWRAHPPAVLRGHRRRQAVYDWDYSRQLLHLRAAEASGEARGVGTGVLEEQLYNERFLLKRPLLQAIDHRRRHTSGAVDRRDRSRRRRVRGVSAGDAVGLPDHDSRARKVHRPARRS